MAAVGLRTMGKEAHDWVLLGEALVVPVGLMPRRAVAVPAGFRRLLGPSLLLAEQYADSPFGPFVSLSLAVPVRLGLRIGYCVAVSAVNHGEARRLGRQRWGLPYELGSLTWCGDADQRRLLWEERGIELHAQVRGRPLPVLIPWRGLQSRADGPVALPSRLRGMARICRAEVVVPADDILAPMAGEHGGFAFANMTMRRDRERPIWGPASLRPALRGPAPGVIGFGRTGSSSARSRRPVDYGAIASGV